MKNGDNRGGRVSESKARDSMEGLIYAFAAFVWWGVVPPLFFSVLTKVKMVGSLEILAHRILWSVLFLGGVLIIAGKWHELVRCFRTWSIFRRLALTTVFVSANWYVYVVAVEANQVVQTSLGYFMNPLVNIVCGLLVFGERLRGLQWLAVGLAAFGVASLTWFTGELPWMALTLAFSFGIYGVIRKTIAADGLACLSVEILLVSPLALAYLLYLGAIGGAAFGNGDALVDFMLILSSVVTALPLLFFGQAARKLPLTTLGFVQYLSPTMAFLIAVLFLGEEMNMGKLLCYACIWVGLVFYSVDLVLHYRQRRIQAGDEEIVVPVESPS
jgi:chloramphenicol-sensitive protein RarD